MKVPKELESCVASPSVWLYLNQAVEDIRMLGRMGANICPVCAHYNHGAGDPKQCPKALKEDCFEWRGTKEG